MATAIIGTGNIGGTNAAALAKELGELARAAVAA
jgi:predicted dinucleotide-binding enzyme